MLALADFLKMPPAGPSFVTLLPLTDLVAFRELQDQGLEFDVADRHSASLPERPATGSNRHPQNSAAPCVPFPLAFYAIRGIGQGMQTGHGNTGPATLAHAELTLTHPLQGVLDAGKSWLSTSASWELISSWTESGAASTRSPEACIQFPQQTQVPARAFATHRAAS